MSFRVSLVLALVGATLLASAPVTEARVFYALEEVHDLAFPGHTKVDEVEYFLSAGQRAEIEKLSKTHLESDFVTAYAGYRDGELMGYAFIDTHQVRTFPETFLVVLSRDGRVTGTHVMAFYEPLEYLPADRWLEQYRGRGLNPSMQVGDRIAGITGSTLTAEAINGGIRRALAIHAVLIRGGQP